MSVSVDGARWEPEGPDPRLLLGVREQGGRLVDVARLADDDALDGDELARIERKLDELIDKAVQGRAQVRAMQGKPAAPARMAAMREGS